MNYAYLFGSKCMLTNPIGILPNAVVIELVCFQVREDSGCRFRVFDFGIQKTNSKGQICLTCHGVFNEQTVVSKEFV